MRRRHCNTIATFRICIERIQIDLWPKTFIYTERVLLMYVYFIFACINYCIMKCEVIDRIIIEEINFLAQSKCV